MACELSNGHVTPEGAVKQ